MCETSSTREDQIFHVILEQANQIHEFPWEAESLKYWSERFSADCISNILVRSLKTAYMSKLCSLHFSCT